jgi:hypothetical protein
MGSTLTQTSTQLVLPVWPSTVKCAHLISGTGTSMDSRGATGGLSRSEQPRTNEYLVRLQPSADAVTGTSVSAAQGSQKPVFALMTKAPNTGVPITGALASGVPPRSRPV